VLFANLTASLDGSLVKKSLQPLHSTVWSREWTTILTWCMMRLESGVHMCTWWRGMKVFSININVFDKLCCLCIVQNHSNTLTAGRPLGQRGKWCESDGNHHFRLARPMHWTQIGHQFAFIFLFLWQSFKCDCCYSLLISCLENLDIVLAQVHNPFVCIAEGCH
jgi:hypothetical protein